MNREGPQQPSVMRPCRRRRCTASQPRTHATQRNARAHTDTHAPAPITTTGDGGRRLWAEQPRLSWRVSGRAQRTDEEAEDEAVEQWSRGTERGALKTTRRTGERSHSAAQQRNDERHQPGPDREEEDERKRRHFLNERACVERTQLAALANVSNNARLITALIIGLPRFSVASRRWAH